MADKRVTVTLECIDNATKKIEECTKSIDKLSNKAKQSTSSGFDKIESSLSNIQKLADGLDFGGLSKGAGYAAELASALGNTKNAGQSVFDVVRIAATAMNELYNASMQDFTTGLRAIADVAGEVISSIIDVGQSFMQMIQYVTGTDLSLNGLIKTSVGYEQSLAMIQMKTGATDKQISALGKTIKGLTRETVYSSGEISNAAIYMAQNGMNVTQIIKNLSAVTGLATAGNIDLARSADIVTSTMNMFTHDTLSAIQVAAIFAKTANTSGASVEGFAQALTNCGPAANQLGIPLTDVATAIAILGNNAIRGSKAGTTLKNIISRLVNPTGEAKKAFDDLNLTQARNKLIQGDLIGSFIEIKKAMKDHNLSADEMVKYEKMLAGAYGYQGLGAILDMNETKLRAIQKAMQDGKIDTDAFTESVGKLMETTQGKMYVFAAAVENAMIKFKEQTGTTFNSILEHATEFVDALTNYGPSEAFKWVFEESCIHLKDMEDFVYKTFKNIGKAVSDGGMIDSMLKAGTNVIQSLCNGIKKAANDGTLQNIMDNTIEKVCDFIINNADDVIDAGKKIIEAFIKGIDNNHFKVDKAIQAVMDIVKAWSTGKGDVAVKFSEFGDTLMTKFCEKLYEVGSRKVKETLNKIFGQNADEQEGSIGFGNLEPSDGFNLWKYLGQVIKDIGSWSGEAYAAEVENTVNGRQPLVTATQKQNDKLQGIMKEYGLTNGTLYIDEVDGSLKTGGGRVIATADEIAEVSASDIKSALESMDVGQLQALNSAMETLGQTTIDTSMDMSTAFQRITDSARTQFLSLAGIVRSQLLNCTNIVKNQTVNMADAFRGGFVSMALIAQNQMTNVRTAVVEKMISIKKVISTQVTEARTVLTQKFMSMAAVTRTQMVNITNIINNQAPKWAKIITAAGNTCNAAIITSFSRLASSARTAMAAVLAVVQNYMSQIASACSKKLTINVGINKTISTTIKAPTLEASVPVVTSLVGTRATTGTDIGLGTLIGSISAAASNGQVIKIEVPLYLEGREIARASAKYMDGELSRVNTRTNRKKGVR